jgi:periplasmic divalent cation tolerance protein
MPRRTRLVLVLTQMPTRAQARRLARLAVEEKRAACATISPAGESVYRWKGRIEVSKEWTVLFKTTRQGATSLVRWIRREHPYECPEILQMADIQSNREYLDWVIAQVKS